ncbi:kinase-like protein [Massarina eburnea CBS 473.64]|uniref:Kinase-like protein n=1 Tax=Massarina eburnea CBS 473.64 TaxID=1395130 RepID=A0A6A6RJV8_9PLEO|nr:kinase-like protein [Massarina eburnea CBS 473.64]
MVRAKEMDRKPVWLPRPGPQQVLGNDRDRTNVQDIYDAYLVFCENGSYRIAWRNLSVLLKLYLNDHFPVGDNDELMVNSDPTRIEYLASLDASQLGYLTKDVLWVLFRWAEFITSDDEVLLCRTRTLVVTRDYLLLFSLETLQILIAEITNELSRRTRLASSPHRHSIAGLSSPWSPLSGTDLGILRFVDVQLSPDDTALLLRFKVKEAVSPRSAKTSSHPETFYDLPKKLLRRALSVGSGTSSKARGHRHRNSFLGGIDSTLVPRAYLKKIRKVSGKPDIGDTINIPNPTSAHAGEPLTASILPSQSELQLFSYDWPRRTLTEITEEFSEGGHTLVVDDQKSNWSDSYTDSVEISQSVDPTPHSINDASSEHSSILPMDGLIRNFYKSESIAPSPATPLTDRRASVGSAGKQSVQSALSSHPSFITAKTEIHISRGTSIDSFMTLTSQSTLSKNPIIQSDYQKMLRERDLIPHPSLETDWSGRGQHADFGEEERDTIPLQVEKVLGQTRNALVESVRCKRVRLVRKRMRCTKWSGLKREDALREVQHLYRLQHSHIVRLVGTYVIGTELSIITYPCAEWNLEQFMESTRTTDDATVKCASLCQFFTCLAKVLDFMHSFPLKHMDIKPQNLLVRDIRSSNVSESDPYKIYFTDFGISRSYESLEECETENPTSFTRTYAALEVVLQEVRDLSADIFSLGCVFAEMLATILDSSGSSRTSKTRIESPSKGLSDKIREIRQRPEGGLRPYHLANEDVCTSLATVPILEPELQAVREWTVQMLQTDASRRPTARQIADDPHLPFPCQSCTLRTGPEDFEAADPLSLTPCSTLPHNSRSNIDVF